MEKEFLKKLHCQVIADAILIIQDQDERVIGRDAVMNIVGKDFVILCGLDEVFRERHSDIEVYMLQSGNGLEFHVNSRKSGKYKVRVHYVQDVKTPKWHSQRL